VAGADIVVDSVGTLTHRAVELVAPGGRVVAFGLDWNASVTLGPAAIASRELTIIGAYLGWGTLPRAVALLAANPDVFRPIASHTFSLADTAAAVSAMQRAESVKSVVMIG
jgi:threonine dehydrogenase-like Zn-dependent dehydrogenase